jgi:hypothetical protein
MCLIIKYRDNFTFTITIGGILLGRETEETH